jgi:hypothetical protein
MGALDKSTRRCDFAKRPKTSMDAAAVAYIALNKIGKFFAARLSAEGSK